MRTHRLITRGSVTPAQADELVTAAAETLQALGSRTAPPARRSLHELLSQAAHSAKAFTPRRHNLNTEAA